MLMTEAKREGRMKLQERGVSRGRREEKGSKALPETRADMAPAVT